MACGSASENSSCVGTKTIQLTDEEKKNNRMILLKVLLDNGFSCVAASGVVGNIMGESGGNPTAYNSCDGVECTPSVGICQWHGSRYTRLNDFANKQGKPWNDMELQAQFMIWEFNNTHKEAAKKIKEQTTPEDAAIACCIFYEVAAHCHNPWKTNGKWDCSKNRKQAAQEMYQKCTNQQ